MADIFSKLYMIDNVDNKRILQIKKWLLLN